MSASGRTSSRIGVLCAGCGLAGSVANFAVRQAEQLASAFDVSLASETLPPSLAPALRPIALRPRRFDALRRLCHVPNALALAAAARTALLAVRPRLELVLFHDMANAALVGRRLWREAGIPYAVCPHEDIACRPRRTYGLAHTALHRWATPLAYRQAAAVLAISPHMAGRARAYGVAPERIALVPTGLDPEEIGVARASSARRSGPSLRLLYAGRLAVEKGVDVLLTAFRLLLDRGVACDLSLVGDGPLLSRLRRQALGLGLGERARFLGSVSRAELGRHYVAADLVCIPSNDEPFGLVALEALMSGTPVAASDVGGLPFVVRHGVNGVLVSPSDSAALANAVRGLDGDRALLASLRRGARRSVRRRFSWERSGDSAVGAVLGALRTAGNRPAAAQ